MHDLDSDFDQFHKMRHIPPGKNFVWRTKQAFSWLQRNPPTPKKWDTLPFNHDQKSKLSLKNMTIPKSCFPLSTSPLLWIPQGISGTHWAVMERRSHCELHQHWDTLQGIELWWRCELHRGAIWRWVEQLRLMERWELEAIGNRKMGKLSLEHFPAWGNLIGEWEMWTSVIWTKGGNKCKNAKYSDSFDLYIYCVNWFRIGHNGPSPHCGQGDECKIVRIINVPTSLTCTTCVLTGMFKCMLTYMFLNSPGQGILLCWHELSTNWSLKKV